MKTSLDKNEFKGRVREWATKLDVNVQAIALRPMSDKWASCSTAGRLNFNSELLNYEPDVADYVIVHELLHFFVPNHGKLWKSLMRAHLGDYESLDKRLRREQ
jgi:predicted metal-dependent hydrolase